MEWKGLLTTHLWFLWRWVENALDIQTCLSLPFQGHLQCCPFPLRSTLVFTSVWWKKTQVALISNLIQVTSQVCFHSMQLKLDYEELCIGCGWASINIKSQDEEDCKTFDFWGSVWHFVVYQGMQILTPMCRKTRTVIFVAHFLASQGSGWKCRNMYTHCGATL